MIIRTLLALAAIPFLAMAGPAFSQDAFPLPAICTANAVHDMGSMDSGPEMKMDQAHTDLMMGMDEMNAQMMKGMSASDIDVAFVCGMIPHHQGAINMAKAELAHGDSEWAKQMAQKVIAAQEQEIADMLNWLAEQSK
ncbi:MAG: DUF305 domain-containing protein [Devosia sp.]